MENNNRVEIDINDLIVTVYNKIAVWNNEDGTPRQKGDYLKIVSADIVETCFEEFASKFAIDMGVEHHKPEEFEEKSSGLFKRNKKKKKK
jgi:hypothetical protein